MPYLPRHDVQPLHKFIHGQPRAGLPKPPSDPADISAPPIESSEDEKDDNGAQSTSKKVTLPDFIDSSDDDKSSGPADLTRTNFRPNPATTAQFSASSVKNASSRNKGNSLGAGKVSIQQRTAGRAGSTYSRKRARDVIDDVEATDSDTVHKKKPESSEGQSSLALGEHMRDGWLLEKRKKPATKGYGNRKAEKPRSATPVLNSLARNVSETPERNVFRMPKQGDIGSPSPQPVLRLSQTLKSNSSGSSPLSSPPSSPSSDPPRPLQTRTKKSESSSDRTKKGKKYSESPPADATQESEFKMPTAYGDYAPDACLPHLDLSPTKSPSKTRVVEPGKILCPICDELVDKELLQTFSKGQRMNLARQAKFCRLHKRKSAEQIWHAKGYPKIDWTTLKRRIERHHDHIKSLIAGKASETHFGSLLQEKIKLGQNRTLLKTDDYLSPGYYGLRGMNLMTETIVEMFSGLLRARAPQDKLISARGYTGFVQAVLVPELAVVLIQEDMSLSAEEARGVMQDSRAVGEALCDERSSRTNTLLKDRDVGKETLGNVHEAEPEKIEEAKPEKSEKAEPEKTEKATEAPTMLKIQEAAETDNESDLSSIASLGDKYQIKNKPDGIDAKKVEVEDSDSDLSSLSDL